MVPEFEETTPSLSERIGGRWALSFRKWLITLFLLPLLAAGYTQNIGDTRSVLLWAVSSFIGLVLVGCFDVLLDRTLFSDRRARPVPAWWVALNSALGGLFIGSCVWLGGTLGGANDTDQLAVRIPGLVLLGAMWGVMLTLLLDYRERANAWRSRHIDLMVQMELMKAQQNAIVEDVIQAVRDETDQEIDRIRELVGKLDFVSASEASAVLRSSAKDAIAPLSRQLWASAKDSYPRIGLWNVLKHAVHSQPFRPVDLAVLTVCLSLFDRISRIGVGRGFAVTSLIVLIVLVQLNRANQLMERFAEVRSRIFVSTIVVVELQTIAVVVWERNMVSETVNYGEVAVSVMASLFLIFLTVGLRSLDLLRGEVTRFVASNMEGERIESIARDRQISTAVREMARDLHGSVQTRLVSCALALEKAAEAGDSESGNAALLEARRILEPSGVQAVNVAMSIPVEVARKVDVWNLLCECTTRIDVGTHSSECANRVGRVVEEAITNAVRHGGATAVDIDIRQQDDDVLVRVSDNGIGPTHGAHGLGSAILDHATEGQWGLDAVDTGAVLTAVVPNN